MKESKYPFVFVASVNIVHPPWAFYNVTKGNKKKPPSVYLNAKSRLGRVCMSFFFSFSLQSANRRALFKGFDYKENQAEFRFPALLFV